ncbi:Inositol phosphorylceramide glucuronosyltransferase 1 [Capsicum chinense]|nr:Inositol phosphorylceramide glucuronosyltransferase 1 [Capsicum chinense]
MYRPMMDLNGIPGAKSLMLWLTAYQWQDQNDIMVMVYLDADTIVVKRIEDLFKYRKFYANLKHFERLKSGVTVVNLLEKVFNDMMSKVTTFPSYTGGFLNSYYVGFANAHVYEPNLPSDILNSRKVPEIERLSTLYNANVGLYMLANKNNLSMEINILEKVAQTVQEKVLPNVHGIYRRLMNTSLVARDKEGNPKARYPPPQTIKLGIQVPYRAKYSSSLLQLSQSALCIQWTFVVPFPLKLDSLPPPSPTVIPKYCLIITPQDIHYFYRSLVYLDADTIIVKSIDDLFKYGKFCANLKHFERLNSGVMVVESSEKVFNDMMSKVTTLPSYTGGDQGFLNSYYVGFANAHIYEPNLPSDILNSRKVPEMERLSTLYNADVGLYMLANKGSALLGLSVGGR